MCMGKDRNGVLVLEHPTADNDYRDPDPTTLHSPKEFWTLGMVNTRRSLYILMIITSYGHTNS